MWAHSHAYTIYTYAYTHKHIYTKHAYVCTHITQAHRVKLISPCPFPQLSIRELLVAGKCPGPFLLSGRHEEILPSTDPPNPICKWEKRMRVWFLRWVSEVSPTITGDLEMETPLSVWGASLENPTP